MARRCGLARDAVWELTPREWYRELLDWRRREEASQNHVAMTAWLVAKLSRAKDVPSLKRLLVGEAATTRRQTMEEQREMLQVLSGLFGGPVRKVQPHG